MFIKKSEKRLIINQLASLSSDVIALQKVIDGIKSCNCSEPKPKHITVKKRTK